MRVTLIDPISVHQIETFSPGLLRTWLGEWLPLLTPVNPEYGRVMIAIFPSFDREGHPDWLCDSRVIGEHYTLETADPDEAMRFIGSLRKQLEARIAALEAKRATHR